jgi:hypothetical protein
MSFECNVDVASIAHQMMTGHQPACQTLCATQDIPLSAASPCFLHCMLLLAFLLLPFTGARCDLP